MRYLRQNTNQRVTVGPFLDVTDAKTPEVALTATNEHLTFVVDDAGVPTLVIDTTATGSGGSNDLVHITNDNAGFYDLELTAAQTNYVGRAVLGVNYVTDHLPVWHEFMIVPANVFDSFFGTDLLDVSLVQVAGSTTNVAALATNVDAVLTDTADMQPKIGTPAGASVSADIAAVKSDTAAILTDTGTTLDGAIATIDTVVDAIKAKTDSLTFTKALELDANIQSINGAGVTGDGNTTPWDGA